MDPRVFPGPTNSELLFLGNNHRAYQLFHNENFTSEPLKVRRCDQRFWDCIKRNKIPEKVMHYIHVAGFSGIIDCGYRKVDNHLVTALIERWRPETHTFHFKFGEATVTLQDVQVLWGLPIGDEVVSGIDHRLSFPEAKELCKEYLGLDVVEDNFRGAQQLKLCSIVEKLEEDFSNNASSEDCVKRARLYILHLLGGTLFPDSSNNTVFLHFLTSLVDLEVCGQLSWASAVLAYLYRNLCKATSPKAIDVYGPNVLLQLWAWERIPSVAPITFSQYEPSMAYGSRWRGRLSFSKTANHTLPQYRSQLQSLQSNEFNWLPYIEVQNALPEKCLSGKESWRCDTCLIFWEVVEAHLPSRVMRQFGMVQAIPHNLIFNMTEHIRLHKSNRKGKAKNWENEHAMYVHMWQSRLNNILNGVSCNTNVASQEYMTWFMSRTAFYTISPSQEGSSRVHQNHGGRFELLGDGLSQVYQSAGNLMDEHPEHSQYFAPFQNIAERYMNLANAEEHMHYRPSHVATNVNDYDFQNSNLGFSQWANQPSVLRNSNLSFTELLNQPNAMQNSNLNFSGCYTPSQNMSHSMTNNFLSGFINSDMPRNVGQRSGTFVSPVPYQNYEDDEPLNRMQQQAQQNQGNRQLRRSNRPITAPTCGTHGRLGHGRQRDR